MSSRTLGELPLVVRLVLDLAVLGAACLGLSIVSALARLTLTDTGSGALGGFGFAGFVGLAGVVGFVGPRT